jgi:peptidylprolyl isomerase
MTSRILLGSLLFLSAPASVVADSSVPPARTPEPSAPKRVKLPSGLEYIDLRVGTGRTPRPGEKVLAHYVGTFTDGKKFDSSIDRGPPFEYTFGVGQVIKGWDEGVSTMRVGGRRRLFIPPSLGYGERGVPPSIPANATLVFEIALIEIRDKT